MPTTTADPATATGTSRPTRRLRGLAAALALAGAAALAACGGTSSEQEASGPPAPSDAAAFGWVHPTPTPAGWRARNLPSGQATLAFPRTWRLTQTDPGTVTAAMRRNGTIAGYLNITPQGGDETLANWASFRPAHNREEGDWNLVPLASAGGLRFTNGHGSCVKDSYSTSTERRYTELACIVQGATATTVIVGATTPGEWNRLSPTLRRAISSFDATA